MSISPTFKIRFTLPTAWKCARSLVNSQIQSKLGCKGERPFYLNWNGIPIDCLVLVSFPTIPGTMATTTTTTTTTTSSSSSNYYYNDDGDANNNNQHISINHHFSWNRSFIMVFTRDNY